MRFVYFFWILSAIPTSLLYAGEYSGQERREITSLSKKDVERILDGNGLGMAKPAELNGYPGPAHVLELASELELDPGQKAEMEKLYTDMQHKAINTGMKYLKAEWQLDLAFRSKKINPHVLRNLIAASSRYQSDLRFIHLSAHLSSVDLLKEKQIHLYHQLRGYGEFQHHHHHHQHQQMKYD